ncbi:MAG: hypothetical protein AAFU67_14080, partial [Bacteroidota bacterium]
MSLLYELIKDLNTEERKSATYWLNCPLHNTREDLRLLFACYEQFVKTSGEEDDHFIWKYCFGDLPYDNQQLRLVKSYLLGTLERWLSFKEWNNSIEMPGQNWLIEAYRQRGLERHLKRRVQERRKALQRNPARNPTGLLFRYDLERVHFDLVAAERRLQKHNLAELNQALDLAMIALKLRAACQALSSGRLTGDESEILFLTNCLEYVAINEIAANNDAIRPFYLACLLLMHNEEAQFRAFRQDLFNHINQYTQDEQRDLLFIAINHCVGQINAGKHDYLQRAFDLYRLGLDQKLLYENGRLSLYTFNNVVGIGLRIGEGDWIANFLADHEEKLPDKGGKEVFALNAARHAYYSKNYEGALVYLRSADFVDFIHHLSARTLQLKIYWELDYQHLLGSHLKNTSALLNRRKKASYHLSNYR